MEWRIIEEAIKLGVFDNNIDADEALYVEGFVNEWRH